MELGIRRDDEGLHHARVKQRAVDQDGRPIGIPSNNLLLDSRRYEVEYLYGTTEVLTANIIAENFCSSIQVLYFAPPTAKQWIDAWSYNRSTILVCSSSLNSSIMKSLIISSNTEFHIKIRVFCSILARLDSFILSLN